MAKKQTFVDKLKKADRGKTADMVKLVQAYRGENGAWKYRTMMVEITDENRNKIYK
jgi:hypothetical protein